MTGALAFVFPCLWIAPSGTIRARYLFVLCSVCGRAAKPVQDVSNRAKMHSEGVGTPSDVRKGRKYA